MRTTWPTWPGLPTWLVLCACLLAWPTAQAHLMPAQRGTLHLVAGGAFMALSLPVSAFSGTDTNGDGLLSPDKLQAHAADIERQVVQGVQLESAAGLRPLQGLMLQLSPDGHTANGAARQLVAMGRFALDGQTQGLRLRQTLYGQGPDEQAQEIVVSQGDRAHRLLLSASQPEGAVLPSVWHTVADHVRQGAVHVLVGWDHLLFLLVVLAAGGTLRQVVLVLSCFTLGHAATLAASVLGGWSAPAAVVEPAIAATILGMAAFDAWRSGKPERASAEPLRLALVFGCALIHGLGLAGALADLGLDTAHRWPSLLGFNVGVELAQVAVACAAAAFMALVVRWRGGAGRAALLRATTATAWLAGSVWLVQRLVSGG